MARSQPDVRNLAQVIPAPVRAVAESLGGGSTRTWLSGICITRWLHGDPPDQYELLTTRPPGEITEQIASAVPIRRDTFAVPTAAGPVDVVSVEDPLAALALKDFTLHAIAYDLASDDWIDPANGLEDLEARRLRSVASPTECLERDAVRGLRAVRLAATHGLSLDPPLRDALPASGRGLREAIPERVRHEMVRLLLADRAREGLTLLRSVGIEQKLAPGVQDDAAAVVAALPADLELRLAGWLRNANAARCLRRMRVSKPIAQRVTRLLQLHPLGAGIPLERFSPLARLLRRNSEDDIRALMALRQAELDVREDSANKRSDVEAWEALTQTLEHVRSELEREQHSDKLAVDGATIMQTLNLSPGPDVGRALRYLHECVTRDPSCNDRSTLLAMLKDWSPQ
ncbi:hypothetical protein MK489_05575 [Myxococcota bacterium]|nr:hypothetical protein [Myxococcota bacterium]